MHRPELRRRLLSRLLFLSAAVASILVLAALVVTTPKDMPPSPELADAVRDYSNDLPAFPGAEGFGTNTEAGRGGKVIVVTTLAGEGPGSLREALAATGPRVVVFEVAGVIDINRPLMIMEPRITVAGQTAPSPGISIVGAGLAISTHDVLVQHLKIRVGDRPEGPDPGGRDGISVSSDPNVPRLAYNVVVDHCSVTWGVDECVSTWRRGTKDVTFSNCIIAEGLSHSIHPKVEHSKGLLIGDYTQRIAAIGNLLAHHTRRSPFVKGDVSALIVNNLVYNPGTAAIHFGDIEDHGPCLAAAIGNVLVTGPDTLRIQPFLNLLLDMKPASRICAQDNDPGGRNLYRAWRARSSWVALEDYAACPVRVMPLTIRPSSETMAWVLANAGARPAERDAIDQRIVDTVRNRSGSIIDSQDEVGGFPVVPPVTCKLELPADPENDADDDGYTNLEEWLHSLAAKVERHSG